MDNQLKAYRSFRIPITNKDKVEFEVGVISHCEGTQRENITEVKGTILANLSLSGAGFYCGKLLDKGSQVKVALRFSSSYFELKGKVVRVQEIYNEYGEVEKFFYGVEYRDSSREYSRNFIKLFISSFGKKKLKEHLTSLLLNERQVNGHGTKEKIELLISIFHDMKKFRETPGFLEGLFQESMRLTKSKGASLYFFDRSQNSLIPFNFETLEKEDFSYSIGESKVFNLVNKGELYKTTFKNGKLDDFYWQVFKKTGQMYDNVICAPIYSEQGKISGVVEFNNSYHEEGHDADDEVFTLLIASVASLMFKEFESGDNSASEFSAYPQGTVSYEIIGISESICHVKEFVDQKSHLEESILISGEVGTGKFHLAQAIHKHSGRSGKSCVILNSHHILGDASFRTMLEGDDEHVGKIELCSGGTLFVQDVDVLSLSHQRIILEKLAPREDIRLICSTSVDLKKFVEQGKFDKEFLEFISELELGLPPLEERKEDIPLLVDYFLMKRCESKGMISKTIELTLLEKLLDYSWPGNVQELKTAIDRLVAYNPNVHVLESYDNDVIPIFDKYHFQRQYYQELLAESGEEIEDVEGFLGEFTESLIRRTIRYHDGDMEKVCHTLDITQNEIDEILSKVAA